MVAECEHISALQGEIEIDESYFLLWVKTLTTASVIGHCVCVAVWLSSIFANLQSCEAKRATGEVSTKRPKKLQSKKVATFSFVGSGVGGGNILFCDEKFKFLAKDGISDSIEQNLNDKF